MVLRKRVIEVLKSFGVGVLGLLFVIVIVIFSPLIALYWIGEDMRGKQDIFKK